MEWKIVRADGEIEVYNATPQGDYYSYSKKYPEMGLLFSTECDIFWCVMKLELSPTDLRYNGAQITCTVSIPECNITRITLPTAINIQG